MQNSKFLKLLSIFFSLIVVLIVMEVIFRILPTTDSHKIMPVNNKMPILHLEPNRQVNLNKGPFFQNQVKKNINSSGYFSDFEFDKSSNNILVVGDSFVEAAHVKNSETFHHILNQKMQPMNVYAIGVTGSHLAQYIAFAEWGAKNFKPKAIIFSIIENDYFESFYKYKPNGGFYYFDYNDSSGKILRKDYKPSKIKIFLRNSALCRYLFLNLKIQPILANIFSPSDNNLVKQSFGLVAVKDNYPNKVVEDSKKAVNFFLNNINRLSKKYNFKPVLVIDGIRPDLYHKNRKAIFSKKMSKYIQTQAKNNNIDYLDLDLIFRDHYLKHNQRFDYLNDHHWNRLGHSVVGESLFLFLQKFSF